LSSRHPFLAAPAPVAIAHRGGAREAPENTLDAFRAAAALGYAHMETDTRVTRDGVAVAFHDESLDRTTDLRGPVAALTIEEVQAADAGYRFSPDKGTTFPFRGRGVRIPRLDELLHELPQARFTVDPKEDAAVEPLAAVLDELDAWERVCVGSFSDRRLRRIRELGRGRACTSMGPAAVALARLASVAGRMPRLGAQAIDVPVRTGAVRIVTARFVAAAHHAGLRVNVWTIDDEQAMHELLDLGVDGIMTDCPILLREVFAARGLPWPRAAA
jgi:glycerophosphoryl diester phosphodiesterase